MCHTRHSNPKLREHPLLTEQCCHCVKSLRISRDFATFKGSRGSNTGTIEEHYRLDYEQEVIS